MFCSDGPDEVCGDPAEVEPTVAPTGPDRDQPRDHRGGAETGRDEEDCLLRHRCRGRRYVQDSDEQLPPLHCKSTGDPGGLSWGTFL